MSQEAIQRLDRQTFTRVVRNVLKDEPEGLASVPLWERMINHPEHGGEAPIKFFHVWLAELRKDGAVVIGIENKRHLHPEHTETDVI